MNSRELTDLETERLNHWVKGLSGQKGILAPNNTTADYANGEQVRILLFKRLNKAEVVVDALPQHYVQFRQDLFLKNAQALFRSKRHENFFWAVLVRWAAKPRVLVGSLSLVLSLVLATFMIQHHFEPDLQDSQWMLLRGGEPPVVVRVAIAELESKTQQILSVLSDPNAKAILLRTTQGNQIQAKVPANSQQAFALEKIGIQIPSHGRLNLLIQPTD